MHYSNFDTLSIEAEEPETIEIPGSGGARKSKLVTSGNTFPFPYDDLRTTWDVVERGHKISENGPCFGWRNFESNYSWITYEEFIKRAEAFGSGLVKIGLNPGPLSNVGIYAQNRLEWVIAQYGVWSKSSVVVPFYDTLGPEECIHCINLAELEIIILDDGNRLRLLLERKNETPILQKIISMNAVNQELKKLASESGIKLYTFDEIENLGEKYQKELMLPQSSDRALIVFTSGTTAMPKGVPLTHENILQTSCAVNVALQGIYPITKEDTMISYLPLGHMLEQFLHLMFLMKGARIGFYSGDHNHLLEDLKILQPTVLTGVPRILNKWYDKAQLLMRKYNKLDAGDEKNLSINSEAVLKPFFENFGGKVKIITCAGAPIYKNIVEFYTKIAGFKFLEMYGQSESGGPCTLNYIEHSYDGSVGAPFPCCIIKLVDAPDFDCFSKDSKGEICIKGDCVFQGYLNNPTKTKEALDSDGWLHTGDIGMWTSNGKVKIIDRQKSYFKISQGLYTAPEKIENVYLMSPFVSQVFVTGLSIKSFLVGIVIPDIETVLPWSKENTKCNSWSEVCNDPAVKAIILDDMHKRGREAGLFSFEQVKAIHLHPEALTYEAGFLTPTSKLKREFCKKYFEKEIETLYNSYEKNI